MIPSLQLRRFAPAARFARVGPLAIALAALLALGARPASAQILYETFETYESTEDLNAAGISPFSDNDDAGVGVGVTDGFSGEATTALSVGINPTEAGAFAGVVVPGGDGVTNISEQAYLSFYVRPSLNADNLPVTLEVNLQEDAAGAEGFQADVDDEFQAVVALDLDAGYQFVQIPIASFTDDNTAGAGSDDGFDFERLEQVVFAIGGLQGSEFTFAIDELIFTEDALPLSGEFTAFDSFDDEDVSDLIPFSDNDDAGVGVGLTTGRDDTPEAALSVGINPAEAGAFAGVVVPGGDGVTNISEQAYLSFYVRPSLNADNLPVTLEVNLQEDAAGAEGFQADVDDEFQAVVALDLDAGYQFVQIPIASFTDDNTAGAGSDDGFDFERLEQVVFAIGGLQGSEFTFAIDDLGFSAGGMPVNNESGAPGTASAFALSAAYPNPFRTSARFDLTLDRAENVRVEVYDVLGRRVALLHEGTLAAQTPHTFALDGQGLSSGLYLYRVTGETFSATRSAVLNR